jgi:hypothetical protein
MVWKRIERFIGTGKKKASGEATEPVASASEVNEGVRGAAPPGSPVNPGGAAKQPLHIPLVKSTENPWGVPLLDVRPLTLSMLSTSKDPQCAVNAVSFQGDDGTSFISQQPSVDRSITTKIVFPIDRMLCDGVLFAPRQMEHKWALFYHQRRIICVRSWLRLVSVIAHVEEREDCVEVTHIRGAYTDETEDPHLRSECSISSSKATRWGFPIPLRYLPASNSSRRRLPPGAFRCLGILRRSPRHMDFRGVYPRSRFERIRCCTLRWLAQMSPPLRQVWLAACRLTCSPGMDWRRCIGHWHLQTLQSWDCCWSAVRRLMFGLLKARRH